MKPQVYCVDCVARLRLNKNKLIGRYDIFLLWYLGNYRDHWYLIFCGAGHKQTVNNFGKVQDRSKTFPTIFSLSLTSNVSSKAVGCFKSYQADIISTKSQQRMSTSSNILDQLVTWPFVIKRFLAICREREMVRTIFSWGFIWDCVNHTCLVHTQHAYIQTCFSDNEFVVLCHVCKMSSHNWHCHVSFACLLSYAILSLIIHHWTCDKYLFILIYGVV